MERRVKWRPGRAIRIRHYPRKFKPIEYLESSDEEVVTTNCQSPTSSSASGKIAENSESSIKKPIATGSSDTLKKPTSLPEPGKRNLQSYTDPVASEKSSVTAEQSVNESTAHTRKKLRTKLNL